jgi:hypothetical protein
MNWVYNTIVSQETNNAGKIIVRISLKNDNDEEMSIFLQFDHNPIMTEIRENVDRLCVILNQEIDEVIE